MDKPHSAEQKALHPVLKVLKGIYIGVSIAFLFLVVLIILFLILYIIKSLLGIDIFPGKHITDWF